MGSLFLSSDEYLLVKSQTPWALEEKEPFSNMSLYFINPPTNPFLKEKIRWHELTVNNVSSCSFTWTQTVTWHRDFSSFMFSTSCWHPENSQRISLKETNFVRRTAFLHFLSLPPTSSSEHKLTSFVPPFLCPPPPSFLPQLSSFFTPLSATINLISPPPSLCQRSFQKDFPSWDLDSLLQTATSPPGGFEPWRTMWRVSAKNCVTPFEFSVCAVWWAVGACVSLCCIRSSWGSRRDF